MSALLLDCDGVIVHSEPLNFACWNEAFGEVLGIRLAGDGSCLVGLDLDGIHQLWCGAAGIDADSLGAAQRARLLALKDAAFRARSPGDLRRVAGIGELVGRARARGLAVGVVSAALRDRLAFTLRAVGLAGPWDVVLAGEDALPGRPRRKDWARAARAVGVEPSACVVVEDSASGIEAARSAGIGRVVGLTTSFPAGPLLAAGAHEVVDHLDQIELG